MAVVVNVTDVPEQIVDVNGLIVTVGVTPLLTTIVIVVLVAESTERQVAVLSITTFTVLPLASDDVT